MICRHQIYVREPSLDLEICLHNRVSVTLVSCLNVRVMYHRDYSPKSKQAKKAEKLQIHNAEL